MPTYDFLCAACGRKFACFTPMGTVKTTCPACGNTEATKQFSASTGIIFKGSGFYKTDSQPKTAASAGSSGAASPPEGAASTSSSPNAQTSSAAAVPAPVSKPEKSGPCCGGSCGS